VQTSITPEGFLALSNSAKNGILAGALLGKPGNVAFFQGFLNALHCIERDGATKAAAAQASRGGYMPSAAFDACWSKLPENIERMTLTEVQQFLRANGVELAFDPVADQKLNAIEQFENKGIPVVDAHDEHAEPRVDVHDSSSLHAAPLFETGIVAQGAPA